jgi:hypothetical protein
MMTLRRWRVARAAISDGHWQILNGRYWTRRGALRAARHVNQTILNLGGAARREIIRSVYVPITVKRLRVVDSFHYIDRRTAQLSPLRPGEARD